MSPERAKVLALTECLMDVPDDPTVATMVRAILAACREEFVSPENRVETG